MCCNLLLVNKCILLHYCGRSVCKLKTKNGDAQIRGMKNKYTKPGKFQQKIVRTKFIITPVLILCYRYKMFIEGIPSETQFYSIFKLLGLNNETMSASWHINIHNFFCILSSSSSYFILPEVELTMQKKLISLELIKQIRVWKREIAAEKIINDVYLLGV